MRLECYSDCFKALSNCKSLLNKFVEVFQMFKIFIRSNKCLKYLFIYFANLNAANKVEKAMNYVNNVIHLYLSFVVFKSMCFY